MSRLKEKYQQEVIAALTKEFGYKNVMAVPRITKVVVNMGLGEGTQNAKIVDTGAEEIGKITGQKAAVTRAKKSIAQFKVRKNMPIGAMVTLRGERMYEFLDRLISIALPRVRDFLLVPDLQAVHLSTTPSHLRQMRTLRPSPSTRWPMRVTLLHSGHTSWTFDALIAASRSTMPPLTFFCGLAFVWRLIMFTPSTTSRFFAGTTFNTRPFLPRSFPAITRTLSFFRSGLCNCDINFCRSADLQAGPTAPRVPAK